MSAKARYHTSIYPQPQRSYPQTLHPFPFSLTILFPFPKPQSSIQNPNLYPTTKYFIYFLFLVLFFFSFFVFITHWVLLGSFGFNFAKIRPTATHNNPLLLFFAKYPKNRLFFATCKILGSSGFFWVRLGKKITQNNPVGCCGLFWVIIFLFPFVFTAVFLVALATLFIPSAVSVHRILKAVKQNTRTD